MIHLPVSYFNLQPSIPIPSLKEKKKYRVAAVHPRRIHRENPKREQRERKHPPLCSNATFQQRRLMNYLIKPEVSGKKILAPLTGARGKGRFKREEASNQPRWGETRRGGRRFFQRSGGRGNEGG